jgi:putative flippase GtrA
MNDTVTERASAHLLRQLFMYALIGALTNVAGYAIYLLLTYLGGAPKLVISILYPVGATIGFFANRRYTFQHDGQLASAGVRYIGAQFAGYLLNVSLLVVCVDHLGFPHQLVQAVAVIVVAVFLFIVSRLFVFPSQAWQDRSNRS